MLSRLVLEKECHPTPSVAVHIKAEIRSSISHRFFKKCTKRSLWLALRQKIALYFLTIHLFVLLTYCWWLFFVFSIRWISFLNSRSKHRLFFLLSREAEFVDSRIMSWAPPIFVKTPYTVCYIHLNRRAHGGPSLFQHLFSYYLVISLNTVFHTVSIDHLLEAYLPKTDNPIYFSSAKYSRAEYHAYYSNFSSY